MTVFLTPALRAELHDALTEALADDVHGDHAGYLALLADAEDGEPIGDDDPLADVINYFGIDA